MKSFLFILFLCLSVYGQHSLEVESELKLISKYNGFSSAGGMIGVWFQLSPGWHTYWENPGESGLPAKFTWKKPPNIEIGKPRWASPQKIVQEDFITFGYKKETLILFPLNVKSPNVKAEKIRIELKVDYLVCKEICLSKSTNLFLNLEMVDDLAPSHFSNLFLKYESRLPREGSKWLSKMELIDDEIILFLNSPFFDGGDYSFDFFPKQEVFDLKGIKVSPFSNLITITLPFLAEADRDIKEIEGILSGDIKKDEAGAFEPFHPVLLKKEIKEKVEVKKLFIVILFAFLGGIILNLMPCVFPVLSIKVTSIMKLGDDKERRLKYGISFALGVIATFCLLSLIIVFLKQSGIALGWGFHLQSPVFVVLMMFLFTALALSFFGWYEIGLFTATFFGRKMSREMGAFSGGVISTLVATPCTAPFMGTAVGYSLNKGWFETLLTFASLGVGMALPFFLLCAFPKSNKWLPKPGEWMNSFKQVMAFPLLGTVLWLFWVWKKQVLGFDKDVYLLSCLLFFCFALWLYGRGFQLGGQRKTKWVWLIFSIILIVGTLKVATGLSGEISSRKGQMPGNKIIEKNGLVWEKFNQQILDKYIADDLPVLIDFTASWCITCQVNKKIAFTEKTKRELREKGVMLLQADWTEYDPEITKALAFYGRSSIPLNVLYLSGEKEPKILPEILTASILSSYLKKINKN